jgi:hypothetical protein
MRHRVICLLTFALASAAIAAQAPSSQTLRAEAAVRAPLAAQLRATPFTVRNSLSVAAVSLRLAPADGSAEAGPNLLDTPIPPGGTRQLSGLRGQCAHRIEIRFANGRTLRRTQDLCEDPDLHLILHAAARPPAAVIDPPRQQLPPPLPAPAPVIRPAPPATTAPIEALPESGSAPADVTAPATGSAETGAAAALPWCPLVEERLPADECAALAAIPRGTGAFKTPERMRRGESSTVILAISREANSDAPAKAIAGAEGREGRFAPAVGRHIEAKLLAEPGLKVEPDPATPELQDLFAGSEGLWRWTITAEQKGEHQLTLRTRVMTKRPDGSFAPKGQAFSDTRRIAVEVEGVDSLVDGSTEANRAFEALTDSSDGLAKLVGALTALVVAIGGLWLAIRRFGKPSKPDDGADGS